MRFYLSESDIKRKILKSFEDHGVQVTSCSFATDDGISMHIEIDDDSDASLAALVKPRNLQQDIAQLATVVGEMLERVNNFGSRMEVLESNLQALEETATKPTPGNYRPNGNKNRNDRRDQKKGILLKPVLEKARQQIEKDAEYVGNPLGSTLVKGQRPLGPNESEDFPE